MTHSEYQSWARAFRTLAKEADINRALSRKAGAAVIWPALQITDRAGADKLAGLVDSFASENQERADNKKGATADLRELVEAMEAFLSATSTPVPSWGVLYPKHREQARDWLKLAYSLFPDLNTTQEGRRESRPASTTATINKEAMAELFQGGFKRADPETGVVPFDSFCNAFVSFLPTYSLTDICRVAKQAWESKAVKKAYRSGPFSKFARRFLVDGCNISPESIPADLAPSRYNKTGVTDLGAFLIIRE